MSSEYQVNTELACKQLLIWWTQPPILGVVAYKVAMYGNLTFHGNGQSGKWGNRSLGSTLRSRRTPGNFSAWGVVTRSLVLWFLWVMV